MEGALPALPPPSALTEIGHRQPAPLVQLIREVSEQRAVLGQRLAELEAAAGQVAARESEATEQNRVLTQRLAEEQSRVRELEQSLENQQSQMQQLKGDNDRLSELVHLLQCKLALVADGRDSTNCQAPGEPLKQSDGKIEELAAAKARTVELERSLEECRDELQQMEYENESLNGRVAELQGNAPATPDQTHHPQELVKETAVNRIAVAVLSRVKQVRSERSSHPAATALWFDQHPDRLKLVSATVAAVIASGQGSGATGEQLLSMALAQISSATQTECLMKKSALADLVRWTEMYPSVLSEIAQLTARMVQEIRTQGKPYLSG